MKTAEQCPKRTVAEAMDCWVENDCAACAAFACKHVPSPEPPSAPRPSKADRVVVLLVLFTASWVISVLLSLVVRLWPW